MASRFLNNTLLTNRPRSFQLPTLSGLSRVVARRVIVLLTVLAILLFLYLTEVSQVTTTVFDIERLKLEYGQLQEQNQELEREIAELESPVHVLRYAEKHRLVPRTEVEYIVVGESNIVISELLETNGQ
jgi:cell division protein FtsB